MGFWSDKTTVKQEPLITPEQQQALSKLMEFMQTGEYGDYKAGEGYSGSLGDFEMTDTEKTGLGNLNALLKSGSPESFQLGKDQLAELFKEGGAYDPYNEKGAYAGYKGTVERQTREGVDAAKRSSGFARNLYSTNAIKKIGDVQARGNEALTNKLGDMYESYVGRRASAIPLAFQAGQAEESMGMNRIGAAYQYGGLSRTLANMEADRKYQEWLRKRQDTLAPLNMAQSIYSTPVTWGVKEMTSRTPGWGQVATGWGVDLMSSWLAGQSVQPKDIAKVASVAGAA